VKLDVMLELAGDFPLYQPALGVKWGWMLGGWLRVGGSALNII